VQERLIYADHIDRELASDLIIFLSRHSSVNPVPVLTVHVTGNIGSADFGGKPGSLPPAAPGWMHAVLCGLSKNAPEGYRVAYEITHHGPSELETPSFFVEVGSTEKEWNDPVAASAVAKSVLCADPADFIPLAGFGGTHYAARETEITLATRGAFGHIAHSRDISGLNADMVRLMAGKSGAVAGYVDRKAVTSEENARLDRMFRECGLVRLTESDLHHMGALSWSTYLSILSLARKIEPGSEVSLHRFPSDGKPETIEIPVDLLEETLKTNEKRFAAGLDDLPLAHLSTGKRAVLPVFITLEENCPDVLNDLISLCVTTLSSEEHIAIEGDYLIIRKMRLDPIKARELGIPKGPLLGDLMKGRNVYVDGREITPDMVRVRDEKKIHIPGLENYL
jgi:D-aminoacyl-tRNA deacylase